MKNAKGWVLLSAVLIGVTAGGCKKEEVAKAGDAPNPGASESHEAEVAPTTPSTLNRPKLHERLSPASFDQRFKDAVANLPALAEREKVKGAAWGYRLTAVDAGSPGEKAGLRVGDSIVAIDGQKAWSELHLSRLRTNEAQKLTVVREDLTSREVEVPPGRLGLRGERQWDAELVYLRGPHRDAQWDDLVRVALGWMWNDPELAETAMTRALAKGYPADGVSDLVGYATSLPNEASPERALEFMRRRKDSGEYGADMPVWPAGVYYAAIAEGDLKMAADALLDGAPDTLEDTSHQLDQLIAAASHASTQPTTGHQTPTEMAQQMKRTPLIPLCRGLNTWASSYLDHMNKVGGPIRIFSPGGHYSPFVVRSIKPAQNVEVEMTFRTRPSDNTKTGFSRLVAVGLMDLDDQRPGPGLDQDGRPGGVLGFAYSGDNEWMSLFHGYGEQIVQRPATFKKEEIVTVRLVHVGGWDEVFVNDERIAYLPWTAPCKKMALYVKSVGMDVGIEHLAYDALESQPEKP